MAALRGLLLFCMAAISLGEADLPSEALAVAEDVAAPCAEGAGGCEVGGEEEELGLDQHMLLLQTGLHVGGSRPHEAASQAAEPPAPTVPEATAPGAAAMAALFQADILAKPAAAGGDPCQVTGSGNVTTQAIKVPGAWTGVLAQKVQVAVAAQGEPSVTVTAYPNLFSKFRAYVSYFGTLVLDVEPGACNLNIVVTLTSPGPLTHLVATSGATVSAESVGGHISASSYSKVAAQNLVGSAASVDASYYASISLGSGHVGSLSASASSSAVMWLGGLTSDFASLTASSGAKLHSPGATLRASISVSSAAILTANVEQAAGMSCSSGATVNITGVGQITPYSTYGCNYHKI